MSAPPRPPPPPSPQGTYRNFNILSGRRKTDPNTKTAIVWQGECWLTRAHLNQPRPTLPRIGQPRATQSTVGQSWGASGAGLMEHPFTRPKRGTTKKNKKYEDTKVARNCAPTPEDATRKNKKIRKHQSCTDLRADARKMQHENKKRKKQKK